MIIYQSQNVIIKYNGPDKQVVQNWYNFVSSVEFREAIDFTVSYVKNNTVLSILSDTLKQMAVKPEDSEYAASAMTPLFQEGLKAMAFVIPEDIFTKISLKKFADLEQKNQHKVEYFHNVEEAKHWVKSVIDS